MTKEEQLRNLDRELWDMTRKLVAWMIPYCPPPKNLKSMQNNNPKGYELLMRYLEKLEEYNWVKNGKTQGSEEDSNRGEDC